MVVSVVAPKRENDKFVVVAHLFSQKEIEVGLAKGPKMDLQKWTFYLN
jgi:hypothetical protein